MSKDNLSREQVSRFERAGIGVRDTTNIAQRLTGQRGAEVTLPDGRSGSAVRDSMREAAEAAERSAVSKSR